MLTVEVLCSKPDSNSRSIRLKGLQEGLGHLNDVGTAQRLITELALPAEHDISDVGVAAGVVIGWHLPDLTKLEAKLSEDVHRFKKASRSGGQ